MLNKFKTFAKPSKSYLSSSSSHLFWSQALHSKIHWHWLLFWLCHIQRWALCRPRFHRGSPPSLLWHLLVSCTVLLPSPRIAQSCSDQNCRSQVVHAFQRVSIDQKKINESTSKIWLFEQLKRRRLYKNKKITYLQIAIGDLVFENVSNLQTPVRWFVSLDLLRLYWFFFWSNSQSFLLLWLSKKFSSSAIICKSTTFLFDLTSERSHFSSLSSLFKFLGSKASCNWFTSFSWGVKSSSGTSRLNRSWSRTLQSKVMSVSQSINRYSEDCCKFKNSN